MSEYCVVVASGNQAKLFTLEPSELPQLESGPNLVKRKTLNSEQRATSSAEMWSEVKSSRNRSPSGGSHAYDDHRDNHIFEYERRFAQDVAHEATDLAARSGAKKVILVAHDRCLGLLRNAMRPNFTNGTQLQEMPKDLSKLTPMDIHAHLAREHLLPERMEPTG